MKSHNLKLLSVLLGILFLIYSQSSSFAADKKSTPKFTATTTGLGTSCLKEKADFKKLYIELQKSLNYEGKDAYLDAKNKVALKVHTGEVYEGKIFEEALFKEYQNSLKKVALMYQTAKFDAAAPAEFSGNPALVDFIKAIDGNGGASYISANNINTVIDGLQKASIAKYPSDSKYRINDNDKYLLKKLLTHAQDRLCSIEKYQETGKRDRNFSAEELEKKKNAPLNQLILAIKDAKITKDFDIKFESIVDEKVAINSAIAANINALIEWAKKNKSCIPVIKTLSFINSIQAGIQQCNYRKFVNALSDENATNIESILHFINSNEKFLKRIQPKAETALDEMKLQAYVDRAFANLGNKIRCTEIQNSTKDKKRLFVRNLPYSDNKNIFDTSKISCKVKIKATKNTPISEKTLTDKECASKIELISDELGRGLEVKQKNPKEAPITFSIKDNPNCQDIDLVIPDAEIKPEVITTVFIFTPANCKAKGEADKSPFQMTSNKEKTACIPRFTDEYCKNIGEDKIPNEDGNECIDKPTSAKTAADCLKEGPNRIPSLTEPTKCMDKPTEINKEACEKLGKDLSEDKMSCVDKKKEEESAATKDCREKNEIISKENDGRPSSDWQVKDNKCINTKDKGDSKFKDTPTEEAEVKNPRAEQPFTAPPRFVPVQIPTRQMYILPGMP